MNGPLVVGVDASTTACKAIAFELDGTPVAEGRRALALVSRGVDGWEQDAESWWTATLEALGELTTALGPDRERVRAMAVAHQRETFVMTDAAGAPLHPALVWMDARCKDEVARATTTLGAERLHAVTGKPPCVTPSFYKASFLLSRLAPALTRARPRLLDVHAFLVQRLTGEFVTSLASADPLGLVDMKARDWSDELLGYLSLDRGSVPTLVEPGAPVGALRSHVADRTGLPHGTPIFAGAGDGQAAGLGAGLVTSDRAYLNLGTALVSGVLSRDYRVDRAFRTLYGALPGTYFLETDLKGGTFTLSWLAEKWLRRKSANDSATEAELLREVEHEAARLPLGTDGLFVVPYWNGVMNPYWDDDARGIVVGLSGEHGPAHLYRAILEGLAFEQRLHTRAVEGALGHPLRELVVMGGGSKSDLFCRIVCDVMARRIARTKTPEATALGAAMLAAGGASLHAGVFAAATAMARAGGAFEPTADAARYDALYERYRAIYPALRRPT